MTQWADWQAGGGGHGRPGCGGAGDLRLDRFRQENFYPPASGDVKRVRFLCAARAVFYGQDGRRRCKTVKGIGEAERVDAEYTGNHVSLRECRYAAAALAVYICIASVYC